MQIDERALEAALAEPVYGSRENYVRRTITAYLSATAQAPEAGAVAWRYRYMLEGKMTRWFLSDRPGKAIERRMENYEEQPLYTLASGAPDAD